MQSRAEYFSVSAAHRAIGARAGEEHNKKRDADATERRLGEPDKCAPHKKREAARWRNIERSLRRAPRA
jgi:hypothetical protein